jgi:hypothetical protein
LEAQADAEVGHAGIDSLLDCGQFLGHLGKMATVVRAVWFERIGLRSRWAAMRQKYGNE